MLDSESLARPRDDPLNKGTSVSPNVALLITFAWPIWVPLSLKIAFWVVGEAYWLFEARGGRRPGKLRARCSHIILRCCVYSR